MCQNKNNLKKNAVGQSFTMKLQNYLNFQMCWRVLKKKKESLWQQATEAQHNKVGWAAELLYRIASYHEGVASPASTSACHCCTLNRWQGADGALCSHTTLATCYVTQEKTQHILGSLLREQYTEQQAETPCSGMWLSLGVVEVALSAAALEGGISTINWVKPFHSPLQRWVRSKPSVVGWWDGAPPPPPTGTQAVVVVVVRLRFGPPD